MLRVFVDSGSSIKQSEKEKYRVDIIPLLFHLGGKEYRDGIDLDHEAFYDFLIHKKEFPKTSLPSLKETEEQIQTYLSQGDEVLILTISGDISGTYNALRLLFEEEANVHVIDTRMAVGGIRILVEEINAHRDEETGRIIERIQNLIPRIRIMAIPETLEYLFLGGRLSKKDYILGSLVNIKPIIGIEDGKVKMFAKKIGLKNAMKYLAVQLIKEECDPDYPIIPSMTYNQANLDTLIALTEPRFHAQMESIDDLDHAIACHWGPNAFGYIFVSKK